VRKSGLTPKNKRAAIFEQEFIDDLRHWIKADRKTALRLLTLVDSVIREPLTGIGKPEPLTGEFGGCWSRRIDDEHRLVYEVTGTYITSIQARYHYKK
jgi:toxin YoeB